MNPYVKFSYKIIKGSVSKRRKIISDYNNKIFNSICENRFGYMFKKKFKILNEIDFDIISKAKKNLQKDLRKKNNKKNKL